MFEDFLKRLLRGYNGVVSALAADLAREFSSGKYRLKCFARFFLRANPNEWSDCSCAPGSFDSLAERSIATKRGCSVN